MIQYDKMAPALKLWHSFCMLWPHNFISQRVWIRLEIKLPHKVLCTDHMETANIGRIQDVHSETEQQR